jgi:short-subunit dehydrogenase
MTKTNFAKANGNDDPNIKFNTATADAVALYAYETMMKGKPVAVPGFFNKLSAFLPRFLSRNRVTKMVGNIQRKNHAKRTDGALEAK